MTLPNEQDRPNDRMPDAAAAGATGGGESDVGRLQASLAAAEAQSAESKDLYMRALAELDNVRKRAARDIENAHKYALERFTNELIGVKDSLELGLASEGTVESLQAGAEATLKLLAKAFENAGVTEIYPQGETFNPEFHEAMVMQPSNEHAPDTVLQVVQKGYQLNGRLLRPARVIVAREP